MRSIKRDDQVLVLSGKERGKRGHVREVLEAKERVIVQGLNMVKRHQKQRTEREPAGIIAKEGAIHISNLKLICTSCQQPTTVTFRTRADGVKVRICKKCHQDID
jgi:large subunit ribosomal protein L24